MGEFERLVGMLSETEKQTKAEVEAQFELALDDEDEMDDIEIIGLDEDDDEEEEEEGEEEEEENVIEAAMRKGVVNLTPENQRKDFITMKPAETSKKIENVENDDEDEDEVRL